MVKQISVFLENKAGRLGKVTQVLGENKINIRALSIADTSDFGILRLIVNDPEQAYQVLKTNGFTVSTTEVLAVQVPDTPGGLAKVLMIMGEGSINIEYLYAFIGNTSKDALVIFKVADPNQALIYCQENKIAFLTAEQVYSL
ncbi:MAG: ACT domain-containing protein [Methylocystaceae bacterium]